VAAQFPFNFPAILASGRVKANWRLCNSYFGPSFQL
jgi:hypothetical protein